MTDKEKAIVMAYTGACMLTGDKFQIFHEYVEDIMGRPVYTHELANKAVEDEIKEKAKDDFIALCEEESEETRWIKTSELLPVQYQDVIVTTEDGYVEIAEYNGINAWTDREVFYYENSDIIAWQPLPDAYKESGV